MDKKIILIGAIGSAVAGYFLLTRFSSGSSSDGSGATGGGNSPQTETKKETYSTQPEYNISFPENPFPEFDFSLPDPDMYRSGSTKKSVATRTVDPMGRTNIMLNPNLTPQEKAQQIRESLGIRR